MKAAMYYFSLLISISVYSQNPVAIGEKVFGKLFPRLINKNAAVLTADEVIMLRTVYPAINIDEKIVYDDGKFYKTHYQQYIEMKSKDETEIQKEIIKYLAEAHDRRIKILNLKVNKIPMIIIRIKKVQVILRYLGYDLKIDGDLGTQSKKAIEQVFNFSCNGLTDNEICNLILNAKDKIHMKTPAFTIEINNDSKTEKIENLIPEKLNEKLRNYECDISEICTTILDPEATIEFKCRDLAGNEVSIKISSKLKASFGFEDQNGRSVNLGVDSKGVISIAKSEKSTY